MCATRCLCTSIYSAAHEQLDSPRVSRASRTRVLAHAHACIRASTREYSHTHTRVLARVHASTRKCTRSRLNACTRFRRSGHASLVPKPSTFFRGGRGLGIDAIDTRSRVLRALVTHAHTRVTRLHSRTRKYSHASSEGVARVRLSSHSRVDTRGPTSCS